MTHRFEWKNIRLVPILHSRMEFAREVRRQFEEFGPDIVAVEYPETLKNKILQGIERLPLLSVVYYEESDGTFTYLLLEPTDGQVEAIRMAVSNGIPVHFIDRDEEGYPFDLTPFPDPYAVAKIGHYAYCRSYLEMRSLEPPISEDVLREKTMAYHLQRLNRQGGKNLFVGGLSHIPGILRMLERPQTQVIGRRKRGGVGLAHLHRGSSREIMGEMPFLAAAYERSRSGKGNDPVDRLEINQEVIRVAEKKYWENSKEELSKNQFRVLNKFARNYALLSGNLTPGFYQLIIAARGAVDDNFSYEVWDAGAEYPWQDDGTTLPVLRLTGDDLFLDRKRIRYTGSRL